MEGKQGAVDAASWWEGSIHEATARTPPRGSTPRDGPSSQEAAWSGFIFHFWAILNMQTQTHIVTKQDAMGPPGADTPLPKFLPCLWFVENLEPPWPSSNSKA